jgi:hypothetical protein
MELVERKSGILKIGWKGERVGWIVKGRGDEIGEGQ